MAKFARVELKSCLQVFVVEDCCADRSREHHDGVLRIYDGYHIKVVRLADLSFATGADLSE